MRIGLNSSTDLAEKIKLVLGRDVQIANDRGFVLAGKDKGELSFKAYEAMNTGEASYDDDKKTLWKNISYEGGSIGAFGIKDKNASEELLNAMSGMAEVILYQYFLIRKLYSVTDIRANFLKDLLVNDKYNTLEEVLPEADVIKINLRAKQAVMVIGITDLIEKYTKSLGRYSEAKKQEKIVEYVQKIEQSIKTSFKDYDQNVIVYDDENRFIVLKSIAGAEEKLKNIDKYMREKADFLMDVLQEELPDHEISIGIGQYYPNLNGLKKSFQDANIALDIGVKIWGKGKVHHILDVGTFAALSGDITHKRKVEISEQVLGKLINDSDILKTVRVFLSSGMNLTVAAKELHLHRNTLIYRLNKAKSIIGLDPKKFNDAMKIKLGLLVCQIK